MTEFEDNDMLETMWRLQEEFMEELKENDKMVEWPVDLTSKAGQRLIKETAFNMDCELHEAMMTLKNKVHRLSEVRMLDRDHYVEELGDTLAFFMEICILSGISPVEMYQEYKRKNAIVRQRLKDGY